MLASFRKMSTGIVAKILMGFLVLSFGVWGIGDIFQSGSEASVAVVEGKPITARELDGLIERLQRNYPEINAEMAMDPTFRVEVLNNLINDELMRLEAASLGLEFSQETLTRVTARNPMFQKPGGGFDRNLFLLTLQQNNHSEASYLTRLRDEMGSSIIHDTLSLGMAPSEKMLELYYAIRNERREGRLVLIRQADIGAVKAPTDENLKEIYDRESARYMEPELRSFRTVQFDADAVWNELKLEATEDTLKKLYEERKDELQVAEQRTVSQLLFSSQDKAQGVSDDIVAGKSFAEAAKDSRVMNNNSTLIGSVPKSSLPDEVSGTVFELAEGGITKPVQSSFGWHIFEVSKITPARTPGFDEVEKQLAQTYRADTAEAKLSELGNALEDSLASGASLEEALKQNGLGNLKIETLGPLSATNTTTDGSVRTLSPTQQHMLNLGYTLEEGQTSSLSLSPDSHYVLVQVAGITPSKLKPFDSVKADLRKTYNERETARLLKEKAESVAKRLGEAESVDAAIKADGIATYQSGVLTRMEDTAGKDSGLAGKNLTTGFIIEMFRLKLGRVSGAYPLPGGEYVIGILDSIAEAPKPKAQDLVGLRTELQTVLPEEVQQLTLMYLRSKYDVEIKQDVLFANSSTEE